MEERERFDDILDLNGEKLVDNVAWYDIISYATEDDKDSEARFKEFYVHLTSRPWLNWEQALYDHPAFEKQKLERNLEFEVYLSKTSPPEDKVACPRCGSTNTKVEGNYKRSMDEAGIAEAVCNNCGKKFHPE